MAKILIVEDDPVLAKSLFLYIRAENHEPVWVPTLLEADQAVAEGDFDVIVLDASLPDGDGIAFCRRLRENGLHLPVLIATAQTSEQAAVSGLDAGANDFVRKPYSFRELLTRIRVQLAGVGVHEEQRHRFAGLEIDLARGKAWFEQAEIPLSRTKLCILAFLMRHANHIVSRDALLQNLRKETDVFDRTIDAHISQLRRALRGHGVTNVQIASIYGAGYKIENLSASPAAC